MKHSKTSSWELKLEGENPRTLLGSVWNPHTIVDLENDIYNNITYISDQLLIQATYTNLAGGWRGEIPRPFYVVYETLILQLILEKDITSLHI